MIKLLVLILMTLAGTAFAAEGRLQAECASCHNIMGPVATSLKEAFAKKGPDFSYAGNKYRKEWLISWLQKPLQIRPAGQFYGDHIKAGVKSDEIDSATLTKHLVLSEADASAMASELMQMKPHNDLIAKEKIDSETISKHAGEMNFDKFWGCMACHLIEPEYGGLSGPELYTAARRLQPEFMASFIRNPQAWEPKTWMPNKEASDGAIQKFVHYLETLSRENANAQ